MKEYDYLVVGAGLFAAVFVRQAIEAGKRCLVIDKRSHIGGNIYCENVDGIHVHQYGAHIFHTDNKQVWDYVNRFVSFNRYTNSPLANYKGKLYNLPFNMNTFYQMWGAITQEDVRKIIELQKKMANIEEPSNLEEQAISLVGKDIYETLIKGYTEKQWGRKATEIPPSIIKRIPVRFVFDNNYFNDNYQGIPIGGYTPIIERMLIDCDVMLNTDYFEKKDCFDNMAARIIYTGEIDRYFNYCYGRLEYRSLKFDTTLLNGVENYQGNAVVNYTDAEVPYTRIIEHKHFEFGNQRDTVITIEYPQSFAKGDEPYYPVNDEHNNTLYEKYRMLAQQEERVDFGGRLAEYKYYNMDEVVKKALDFSNK